MKSRLKMSEKEGKKDSLSRLTIIEFNKAASHGLRKHVSTSTQSKKIRILKDRLSGNTAFLNMV
jgi:hypothetical protein